MSLRSVSPLLKHARRVSIILHQEPDGDVIGSAVAFKQALEANKQNVELVCSTAIPAVFLRFFGQLNIKKTLSKGSDAIVILDAGELHRTGFERELIELANRKLIVAIDHHPVGNLKKITRHYIHRPTVSSTAEIIYEFLEAWRLPITKNSAEAMLLGIYTDTGGFRHANTSSQTLTIASRLVRLGANLNRISRTFNQKRSVGQTKLWGILLSNLAINPFGLVVVKVNRYLMTSCLASHEDLTGLGNLLTQIDGARAVLVMFETDSGWQGSLRTRHRRINLGRFAGYFGGRGSRNSAGFVATDELISGKIVTDEKPI